MDANFTGGLTYAPLTIAEVCAVLDRHKKRLVCAANVYEQVQSAVREARLEGVYQVLENQWLKDGQVVLMVSEADMEDLIFSSPTL